MSDTNTNKQINQNFIQVVWKDRNLTALKDFWTEDCLNYAIPDKNNRGIEATKIYHESFFADLSAFCNVQIEILQQIAEGDRVVTYIRSQGEHSRIFLGISPTGKRISLSAIRLDRIQDEKIAEHWSVSDAASLVQQLQT